MPGTFDTGRTCSALLIDTALDGVNMLFELTKPLNVLDDSDDGDDDVEHLVCCNENISLCGEDVSDCVMIDDSDGLSHEGVCVVCAALHVTDLPCSPNCPFA